MEQKATRRTVLGTFAVPALAMLSPAAATKLVAVPVRPSLPGRFDEAHAQFQRLKAIENGFGGWKTMEEEALHQGELEAATDATDAAFADMIAIPISDPLHALAKLQAIVGHYDVCGCGLNRAAADQVMREVETALIGAGRG